MPGTPWAVFPELETPRLRLRPLVPDDAEALLRIFGDPRVAEHTDVETWTTTAQSEQLLGWAGGIWRDRTGLRWGIELRPERALVGTCGFHLLVHEAARAQLGYDLAREFWRRGIMTEAITAALGFGFGALGLNRVEALVNPDNAPSAALLRSLGFREEGILRAYAYFRGRHWDQRCFSLLQAEFSADSARAGE